MLSVSARSALLTLADHLGEEQPGDDGCSGRCGLVCAVRRSAERSTRAPLVHALNGALPPADNLLLQQARVVHAALAPRLRPFRRSASS
jgi:hypothetical protein